MDLLESGFEVDVVISRSTQGDQLNFVLTEDLERFFAEDVVDECADGFMPLSEGSRFRSQMVREIRDLETKALVGLVKRFDIIRLGVEERDLDRRKVASIH